MIICLLKRWELKKDGSKWSFQGYDFFALSDFSQSNEDRKRLMSEDRYHVCHEMSCKMIGGIPGSQLMIGMSRRVYGIDFLHSVVLVGGNVFDYTKNLIMPVQDYVKLSSFRAFNVIPREKLIAYSNELHKKIEGISGVFIDTSEFCLWPEEILDALDRIAKEQIKK